MTTTPLHNTEPFGMEGNDKVENGHHKVNFSTRSGTKKAGSSSSTNKGLRSSNKSQCIKNTYDSWNTSTWKDVKISRSWSINTKFAENSEQCIKADNVDTWMWSQIQRDYNTGNLTKTAAARVIASTHKYYGHQDTDHHYNKIKVTFCWKGMKNDIGQVIANCKMEKETPNRHTNMHSHW